MRVITVYRNGDLSHRGNKYVVSRRLVSDLDQLCVMLSEIVPVVGGIRKLYTTNARRIQSIDQLFEMESKVWKKITYFFFWC